MKRTTIVLPDDMAELVEREAKRLGIPVSELVRRAIRQTLLGSRSKPRDIPWAGIIDDPRMIPGSRVDEELEKDWQRDLDSGR
jgi:Arc/MetJ-type ribon-helix-helix transcriptional regulator